MASANTPIPRGEIVFERTLWKYNLAANTDKVWQVRIIRSAGQNYIVRRWGRRREAGQEPKYQVTVEQSVKMGFGAERRALEYFEEKEADGYFPVLASIVLMDDQPYG